MPFKSTLLALLIASSLFFSGCLGFLDDDPEVEDQDEEKDDSNMDHSNMDHDMDNDTDDGDKADNESAEPPVASLSANLTEGAAPLAVGFTLEAEHDDPEGLTWSLDIGDVGVKSEDSLPTTVNHTFDAAGNYTVVLNVSHGDVSDESNVTITVTEAAGSEPNALQEGDNGLCLDYNVLYNQEQESPLAAKIEVDPGTGYQASSPDGTALIDFHDADGGWIEGGGEEGTVPDNASYGIMCVAAAGDYPVVPAPAASWTYQDGFEATA